MKQRKKDLEKKNRASGSYETTSNGLIYIYSWSPCTGGEGGWIENTENFFQILYKL